MARTLTFVDQAGAPVEYVVVQLVGTAAVDFDPHPVMDQVNKTFQPHVLVVNAGQSVSFPNSDNIRHHVYSFSTPRVFEIKLFRGTEADPVTFDTPGVVVLGCNIHDTMVGYIYVTDNAPARVSDARGSIEIDDSIRRVLVWHPRLSTDHSRRLEIDLSGVAMPVQLDLIAEKPSEKKRSFKARFSSGGD